MKIQRIYSWNPLGKVAKKFDNVKKDFTDGADKWKNRFKGAANFVTDTMSKKDVEDFVSKELGTKVKVGEIKKVKNPFGSMYKWFGGIPSEKSYAGWYVFRNGNDIKIPAGTWFSFNTNDIREQQEKVLEWYNSQDPKEITSFR